MHHAPWVEHTLDSAHWILPLPLSAQRLRERGYNQALELAKSLVPSKVQSTWLCRHEGEAHQVGASRQERFDNVRGTFWIHPDAQSILKNQRIVLIDDVMTSGATMFEAARTLRQAGVAHIAGLVFARTPSRYGARQ
jgi:predicted amidophosphoribosyltransferase